MEENSAQWLIHLNLWGISAPAMPSSASQPYCPAPVSGGPTTLYINTELFITLLETLTTNICISIPDLAGDTSHLLYRAQPVNAVWGNSRCLL
jgi:hypothetical protein